MFFIIAVVSLGVGVLAAYLRDFSFSKSAKTSSEVPKVSFSPSPQPLSFRDCGLVTDDVMQTLEFSIQSGGELKVTKLPPLNDASREALACYYGLLVNCGNGKVKFSEEGDIVIKPTDNLCSYAMLDKDQKGLECFFPSGTMVLFFPASADEQIKNAPANFKEAYQVAVFQKSFMTALILQGLVAGPEAEEILLELEGGQKVTCLEKK